MAGKLVFESPRFLIKTGQRSTPRAGGAAQTARREPLPIVVGCPRSGTSLLAVMLDSHPLVALPPETAFLPVVMALEGPAASLRQRFFDIVTANRITVSNWSDFGLEADALRERLEAIEPFTVAAGVRAFYALYAEQERKPRYGDKTPGYVFSMSAIAALLPEAHFIHMIRDPGDTALSWRRTWFAPSQDLRLLGQAWRQHVEAGRRAGATLRRYTELRYEELVREPERELRRLCDFLSLAWDPAMLDYRTQGAARIERLHGRKLARGPMIPPDARRSIHSNLTRPLDADRVGVWRREMSAAERRQLEAGAGPLVRELGYAA